MTVKRYRPYFDLGPSDLAALRSGSQRAAMRLAAFFLLLATTLGAYPQPTDAQQASARPAPNAAGTYVSVTRQELRVVFPRDTATTWGWPERLAPGHQARYDWIVSIDGVDGPKVLRMLVDGSGAPEARRFASLESLVASASPSFCGADVIGYCPTRAASLFASDGRVVLTYRDSATISRLFLLRQATVDVARLIPTDSLPIQETVPVDYVQPEIPPPNADTRAEAERARRAYDRSVRSVERYIGGGPQPYGTLWVQLGDSVLAGVAEMHCFHDVCWSPGFESAIAWSVDDTSVVSTRVVVPDTLSPDSSIVYFTFSRARPLVLRGRKLGRTMVRAELEASESDTFPSRTPPSRSLAREVNVIPRVARVELTAPSRTIRAGEEVELRIRVLDALGRRVAVPVDVEYAGNGTVLGESRERVPYTFPAGRATVIARFGPAADTLVLDVLPARKPRR